MSTKPSTLPYFRVEHRPHIGSGAVLAAGARLREMAEALDVHWVRLAALGLRGTLVLVCEVAGQDFDLVERRIGPRRRVMTATEI